MKFLLFFLLSLVGILPLQAGESLPSPPSHYFNDYASVISPAVSENLNQQLARFDQTTSNQIVVAIYPKFFSDSSLDDVAQRLYSSWHLGTKKNSNGVLLLIFPTEHQIRIQTGYGLEGALPDALCNRIIDEVMAPAFRQGDYNTGVMNGLDAIMKATQGEYQGVPTTHPKKRSWWVRLLFSPIGLFFLFMIFTSLLRLRRRGLGAAATAGWFMGGGGFGGGSGGGGGGWGGFSGGGGDSGGGGSSGGW